jgi:hypothetical protein
MAKTKDVKTRKALAEMSRAWHDKKNRKIFLRDRAVRKALKEAQHG